MRTLVKAVGLILVGILLLWPRSMIDSNQERIHICQAGDKLSADAGQVCRYPIDRSLQQYRLDMGLEMQRTG